MKTKENEDLQSRRHGKFLSQTQIKGEKHINNEGNEENSHSPMHPMNAITIPAHIERRKNEF